MPEGPLPIQGAIQLLEDKRAELPVGLRDKSAYEIAKIRKQERPDDNRFDNLVGSNIATRTLGKVNVELEEFGNAVEEKVSKYVHPYVAKGPNFLIQSLPEFVVGGAALATAPYTGGASIPLAAALMGGTTAVRTYAGTDDVKQSLVSGGLSAAAIPLAGAGAGIAGRLGGGALSKALAGMAGGSAPDLAEIQLYNPGGLREFVKDPANVIGLAMAEVPFAAVDYMTTKGQNIREAVTQKIGEIDTLDTINEREGKNQILADLGIIDNRFATDQLRQKVADGLKAKDITPDEAQLALLKEIPQSQMTDETNSLADQVTANVVETDAYNILKDSTARTESLVSGDSDKFLSIATEPQIEPDMPSIYGLGLNKLLVDKPDIEFDNNLHQSMQDIRQQLFDQAKEDNVELSSPEFLTTLLEQEEGSFNKKAHYDVLARFFTNLKVGNHNVFVTKLGKGKKGSTRQGFGGFFDKKTKKSFVNVQGKSAEDIYVTATHEMSHAALNELRHSNPETYGRIQGAALDLGFDGRKSILTDLAKLTKSEGQSNIDYLAGLESVDKPANSDLAITYEFMGGITEMLSRHEYNKSKQPTGKITELITLLPLDIQLWITKAARTVKDWFGIDSPASIHLTKSAKEKLSQSIGLMEAITKESSLVNQQAYELLGNTERYNHEDLLTSNIFGEGSQGKHNDNGNLTHMAGASEEFMLFSKNILKETTDKKDSLSWGQKYFLTPLFRARQYPWTRPLFNHISTFRRQTAARQKQYIHNLGQNKEGTLSDSKAGKVFIDWYQGLTAPKVGKANKTRIKKIDSVLAENNVRREQTGQFDASGLVSETEMINNFGLSPEDAEMAYKLSRVTEQVALSEQAMLTEANETQTAGWLYSHGKKKFIDLNEAKQISKQFTRLGNEIGANRLEFDQINFQLQSLKKSPQKTDANLAELNGKLAQLEAEYKQMSSLTEQTMRTILGEKFEFGEFGQNVFINDTHQLLGVLGKTRIKQAVITRNPGYTPQVRRGQFVIVRHGIDQNGDYKPVDSQGFHTKKEAEAYVIKNKLADEDYDIYDKTEITDRLKYQTGSALNQLNEKAKADLTRLIDSQVQNLADDPFKEEITSTLQTIADSYTPLSEDIKSAISVKGDAYAQRKYNVEGFNFADALPNIFEYIDFKTVAGQKGITKAATDLELLLPEFDQNPDLKQRSIDDIDYVLNSGNAREANLARKMIFYYYLGASARFVVQNGFQNILQGLPALRQDGAGYVESWKMLTSSLKLQKDWISKGSTGDKQMDTLVKQAEKDDVFGASAIEFLLPAEDNAEGSSRAIQDIVEGNRPIGSRIDYAKYKAGNIVDSIMRSTAVFSEAVNRRASFTMGVLNARKQGVTDMNELYRLGSETSDNINFVGNKANRPGFISQSKNDWTHSPLMLATALQSFTINSISQLATFWKEGRIGSLDIKTGMRRDDAAKTFIGNSVNFKNPAVRAFYTSIAHYMALSGIMGLVGAETAEQLFEGITGISMRTALRKGLINTAGIAGLDEESGSAIADAVLGGLPAALGVETSGSLGLGRPIEYTAGKEPSIMNLAGPAGGLVESGIRAAKDITKDPLSWDQWRKGIRGISPKGLSYWTKLADAAFKNQYLDRRLQPITEGLTPQSTFAVAMGFRPTQVAKARRMQFKQIRDEKRTAVDRNTASELVSNELFKFQSTGDPAAQQKAIQYFNNYIRERAGEQNRKGLIDSTTFKLAKFQHPYQKPVSLADTRSLLANQEAYPSVIRQSYPKLTQAVDALKVSQILGQTDEVARRAKSLHSTFRKKALYDKLVQAGLPESIASRLSQGDKQSVQRLRDLQQLQSPVLAKLPELLQARTSAGSPRTPTGAAF